jgi:hypothetical protein
VIFWRGRWSRGLDRKAISASSHEALHSNTSSARASGIFLSLRVLAATVRVTALQERRLVCCSRAAIIWQKIKRPRNARGRVTQMALRRTGTPAFFPVSAHTPRSPIVSPEHRVEFRAGSCVVTAPADASGFSCGGIGRHLSRTASPYSRHERCVIEALAQRASGKVKLHEVDAHGRVSKISAEEDYGLHRDTG